MIFLEQWKNAKKAYETATGQHKPSEKGKFLGFTYNKSSGIEAALHAVDIALAKKDVEGGNRALRQFKETVEQYFPTIKKLTKEIGDAARAGTKGKVKDANLLDVQIEQLIGALLQIGKQIQAQLDGLAKDKK